MTEPPPYVATARRFLRRRLVAGVATLVVGGLLLATGIAGLGYLSSRTSRLATTGIHASANVTFADNYTSRFQFDEHIDVSFRIAGVVVQARCWTGPGDIYQTGQSVAIVYDTNNPLNAQLANNPDPGPAATPFLAALVLGIILIIPATYTVVARRGLAAALNEPDHPMTATKSQWRRITLQDNNNTNQTIWTRGRIKDFPANNQEVRVFGQSPILVIDPAINAITFSRPKTEEETNEVQAPSARTSKKQT